MVRKSEETLLLVDVESRIDSRQLEFDHFRETIDALYSEIVIILQDDGRKLRDSYGVLEHPG